mmetsp:Transcript_19677/g.38736  ORF Transcript_19677/g.38736 Transcript_19677/m.38736 type:complete len:395 (+) Transcript_19677:2646-3830(+)
MIDDIHVGIAIVVAVSNGDQIAEPARPVGKGADFFPRENLRRLVGVGGGGGDGHEGRRGSGAGGRGADPRVIVGRVGYRRRGGVVGGGSGGEDDGVSVFVEEAVGSFVVSVGRCVRWLWLFVVPLRMTFFFVSRSRGGSELPVVPSCDIRFHGRFSGIHRGQLGRQWILEQHRRELKFIRVVVVVLVFPSVRVKVHFAAAIAIRRGGRRRRSVRTSTRRTAAVVVVASALLRRRPSRHPGISFARRSGADFESRSRRSLRGSVGRGIFGSGEYVPTRVVSGGSRSGIASAIHGKGSAASRRRRGRRRRLVRNSVEPLPVGRERPPAGLVGFALGNRVRRSSGSNFRFEFERVDFARSRRLQPRYHRRGQQLRETKQPQYCACHDSFEIPSSRKY